MSKSSIVKSIKNADGEQGVRLTNLGKGTLFDYLSNEEQEFVVSTHKEYRLTVQEIRELCEVTRDLFMWQETSILNWWREAEKNLSKGLTSKLKKKMLFAKLRDFTTDIKKNNTKYSKNLVSKPERPSLKFQYKKDDSSVFGDCPVRSERTLCCNLKTIDAVQNCAFGCSYCTIQTFYGDRVIVDAELPKKLASLNIERGRFYHIGTGQSSDSLVWGNRDGILDTLCEFAFKHPDVLLELKTKSANVEYFMKHEIPSNVVCSWSLNTEIIIENEEHMTANLRKRLEAARKIADRGVKVAFHFHPMVLYEGWKIEYPELAERIIELFNPNEVSFISMGSITFIKPVIKQIRRRGEPSRILQSEFVKDPHGKFTYSDGIKTDMFRTMYKVLAEWHNSVFIYLCMEKPEIWDQAFGWRFASNAEFEKSFAKKTLYRNN